MRRFNILLQTAHCLAFIGLALTLPAYAAPVSLPTKMDSLMPETHTSMKYPQIESLEMVGVGVSVETWRNHPDYPKFNLWQAVEASNGSYIISQDAKQYPKEFSEQRMASAKRKGDAVDAAMRDFMDRYPLPIAVVGPAWHGPDNEKERTIQRNDNARSFITTR